MPRSRSANATGPIKLADIAAELNLSIATVSRALHPTTAHLISEAVRLRVQSAAARLGYVANQAARQLVQGRSYTLGVVVATAFGSVFFSDYLLKLMEGLYSVLKKEKRYGYKLVLLPHERNLNEIDRHILSSEADGLLISTQCDFSASELYTLAERLQNRSRRPVVALNLPFKKGSRVTNVSFDNREAAKAAVTYLIKRGRRQIGLVYADNNAEDVRERVEGYKAALVAHRIILRPELIAEGDFSTSGGRRAAQQILKSQKSCDALFCINDEMAVGALAAVRDTGRRCPDNISVMGFDGIMAGDWVQPSLSTIAQPVTQMASKGAQILIDQIEHRKKYPLFTAIPAKLLLRESA